MDGPGPVIVVRAPNWLGDTVMALPALRALRGARPEARITVVGHWAPLLAGQGVADLLLPYPGRLRARLDFGRSLRAERPDLAVLLPNSFESALAARWWRAKRRLGFDTDARRFLLTDPVPMPAPRLHQSDEYGALLGPLGVRVAEAEPRWNLLADARDDGEVGRLLAEAGIAPTARLVGLHLGAASGSSKLWPPASFGQLARRLRADRLLPVLLGAPGDDATAAAVSAAAGHPLPCLVGKDRPALLPRLLSRLDCLVSGDTGVAHLAAALGVPTVTLFGPTDPRLTAPRSPRGRVIRGTAPCAPCFLPSCPIDHVCLRGIQPDDVLRHVKAAA